MYIKKGILKEYTEDIHAVYLKKMLKEPCICDICPANVKAWTQEWKNNPCDVCLSFILLPEEIKYLSCPCHILGSKEARERTWKALEKKGYLK